MLETILNLEGSFSLMKDRIIEEKCNRFQKH